MSKHIALVMWLPVVPLYHESVASADVMAYLEELGDAELRDEAHCVLYSAYGTYVGGALGYAYPPASLPIYYGSVLGGHLAGRWQSRRISGSSRNTNQEADHGDLSRQPR